MKKTFYLGATVISILLLAILVYAYGGTNPAIHGHDSGELDYGPNYDVQYFTINPSYDTWTDLYEVPWQSSGKITLAAINPSASAYNCYIEIPFSYHNSPQANFEYHFCGTNPSFNWDSSTLQIKNPSSYGFRFAVKIEDYHPIQ